MKDSYSLLFAALFALPKRTLHNGLEGVALLILLLDYISKDVREVAHNATVM